MAENTVKCSYKVYSVYVQLENNGHYCNKYKYIVQPFY